MALDIAPSLYVLVRNFLVSDPSFPKWFNRDRFVLSSGHTSALLYAMLHIAGYGLTIDDLKSFRQWGSLTPGHPEYGHTTGVDATAGPLGQGVSQAVGMAMAEEKVAASYKDGTTLCHHMTYCLCGDGDLEEGLSQEAISLAGLQKLGRLVMIYDANGSTLDGPTSNSLMEDEGARFLASNWRVFSVKDGNNLQEISEALEKAQTNVGKPTLIIVHTIIGYGTELAGNHKVHGSPLGEAIGEEAKKVYGYNYPEFTVPNEVYERLAKTFIARGKASRDSYELALKSYKEKNPDEFILFQKALNPDVSSIMPAIPSVLKDEASRATSGTIVANLPNYIPWIIGGSADVASSVKTAIPGDPGFGAEHREAHNVNFGIREFAMAGAQNGMLLHGGLRTYVGCFLIFSDYMKSAIRMSSLEHIPAIYLFSHDSVAVGEDGPTHEPIEQLEGLRTIPGLSTIRPADARETYAAWRLALSSINHPTALILSRQNLPLLANSSEEGVKHGAYILEKNPKATIQLLASGSEVSLALSVQSLLKKDGIESEVISFPSVDLFLKSDKTYQDAVLHLPRQCRYSFEMGATSGWYRFAEHVYGIDYFGYSAPAEVILEHLGFTPEASYEWVKKELA
jgi:transketolase